MSVPPKGPKGPRTELPPGRDFAIPIGTTEDGGTRFIRHSPDHTITTGVIRPIKDGEPFSGDEIVRATPDGAGWLLESLYKPEGNGPAKVNGPSFRSGWDRTFGGKREKKDMN